MKAKVSVLKTKPETVLEDYSRLMNLADYKKHMPEGVPVILKDNISWHFLYPGANTTPWQLEGVIKELKNGGYNEQIAVQNNTVVTDPYKGERLNKYLPVFKKYDIPILYNFKSEDIKWIDYKPKGKMLILDKIYPEGIKIPEYFLDKSVIHLPTVKCHIYTTTTGAMKNAFGGLLNTKRHYTHSVIHKTLVDLLRIQKEIHPGIFAVMDGTTCGNGPGPRTMTSVVKNYILASADQVAIDAVAAKMMGFNPMDIDYIRIAHEEGLGIGKPSEIEVVGEDVSKLNFGFSVGNNFASSVGKFIWFGPLKKLQHLFFHTPMVYLFVFASFFYHDFFWYPVKGWPKVKKWLNETPWGELFKTY